jgi:hypothetical protein
MLVELCELKKFLLMFWPRGVVVPDPRHPPVALILRLEETLLLVRDEFKLPFPVLLEITTLAPEFLRAAMKFWVLPEIFLFEKPPRIW